MPGEGAEDETAGAQLGGAAAAGSGGAAAVRTEPTRFLSLLGLARRGGKLALGDMAVRDALSRRKAHLLVLATDAGRSTTGSMRHLAETVNCPVATVSTKSELGRALGLGPIAAIAVRDVNLTKGLRLALAPSGSAANTGVDE